EAIHRQHEELILRSHSDRSFMQESTRVVEDTIRLKFSLMRHVVEEILRTNPETRLWVFDDSIVRGSVSRKITRALRELGFKWIGWLLGVPPLLGPCHKGMDLPGKGRILIAPKFMESKLVPDSKKIAEAIEADFVGYPYIQDLRDAVRHFGKNPDDFCFGCFENRDPIWGKW
ncbi:MAG: hypothetical protein HYT62_01310, partial [Candidatus Yanofskybacteria bacterium]|nr:hypothetical protein [Candidatus Yanofskybacteria bacterium]